MKERIREIIQSQNSNRGLLWTEEDKEKFAELIVKECASKVVRNEALNILEHFGVK